MNTRYYRRDGTPYEGSSSEAAVLWACDLESQSQKRVAETTLPDGTWVSTVWLGLNQRWGDGPPLIFETMVFSGEAEMDECDMARYSTESEAIVGHRKMVRKWRRMLGRH